MKNFITASLIIVVFAIPCPGQDTFQKLISLEFSVSRFSAVLPTDSCYYVTGTFTDTITPARTGVHLSKIGLGGELLSINTIKHPDMWFFNDYCDLGVNHTGQLFFVGSVNDEPGSNNAIFYLYDEDGDTLLTKKFDSILYPDYDFVLPGAATALSSGGYAVVNSHEAGESPHQSDISLLLIDDELEVVVYLDYAKTSLYEIPWSMTIDGDSIIMGAARSNRGQVLTNYTNRTLIIKTDGDGNELWQWLSPAGALRDGAKAMIKTPDGGLVVASGIGTESDSNPNFHNLFWDAMIFKLDADRDIVWSTPFRGFHPSTQTGLTEMVGATDGNGFVASGIVAEKEGNDPAYHTSWLVKVSPEGDSLWTRRYTYFDGDFVAPEVYDMKATPDGGYVLVGYSPNVGLPAPGWIMKVDSFGCLIPGCNANDGTPTLDGEAPAAPQLDIYPNPVGDFLNFRLRGRPLKDASYRIINAEGRLVEDIPAAGPGTTISVPVWDWPGGAYFLQYLAGGQNIVSEKFIIQK